LGWPVLHMYEETGDSRYLKAARRQYEYLQTNAKRTAENAIAHHRGQIELWVDSLFMLCPFLARFGEVTGETEAFDEATHQIKIQAKHLQDPHTGLFRHEWREQPNSYPESTFWSRGNGWALAGILETLDYIPSNHPDREQLAEIFSRTAAAVVERQDASGFWHNVLDDDQTPLETSGTLMFAYSFARGTEMGLLTDDQYMDAAEAAIDVAAGTVDPEGKVRRVATPPGGAGAPLGVTSYGQGWFLKTIDWFV